MRTDATGTTEMTMRKARGARLVTGVVAALLLAVLAPVLLVNGAAGVFVGGAVVLAIAAGVDAMVTADHLLRQPAPVVAAEHTLAA